MPENQLTTGAQTQVALADDWVATAAKTFEGIEKIAGMMSAMATMPDHLQGNPADCFRIVAQAVRWNFDPFAVAECSSLVRGKICYEGKLVNALLQRAGIALDFEISGSGDDMEIVVSGKRPLDGKVVSTTGTVRGWRTSIKDKSGREIGAWSKQPKSQLKYRGARQWAREHAPNVLMGVYTPDEIAEPRVRDVESFVVVEDPQPAKVRDVDPEPMSEEQHSLYNEARDYASRLWAMGESGKATVIDALKSSRGEQRNLEKVPEEEIKAVLDKLVKAYESIGDPEF